MLSISGVQSSKWALSRGHARGHGIRRDLGASPKTVTPPRRARNEAGQSPGTAVVSDTETRFQRHETFPTAHASAVARGLCPLCRPRCSTFKPAISHCAQHAYAELAHDANARRRGTPFAAVCAQPADGSHHSFKASARLDSCVQRSCEVLGLDEIRGIT
ncbi:hypothetical protein OBBRIDRAFT_624016 [Obba rivulosa]|uniref:Uncharacterized protein n=1 Tax=Obba rivulosa TaxID=1052685 RepID=A0A8E2ATJ2_9APHY|nr:hypothetical protein OBBRIDRAFT_624016 [Obba rivulosa]